MRGLRLLVAVSVSVSLGALCTSSPLKVPSPTNDQPPEVLVSHLVRAELGTVVPDSVRSVDGLAASTTVGPASKPCAIPNVQLLISARNPRGGVRELRAVATSGSLTVFDHKTQAAKDGAGEVPPGLALTYYETPAGNHSINLEFGGGKAGCPTPETFVLTVTATNWNDQTTTFVDTISAPGLSRRGCICE